MALSVVHDRDLLDIVATKFDLRTPNREALEATVSRLADRDYEPTEPLVLNLATGVGKTYVMGSLIEYLRELGHRTVMVVTPGLVIQAKTAANLDKSHRKYIGGFDVQPQVITPENQRSWNNHHGAAANPSFTGSRVFIFNVQTLLAPATTANTTGTTLTARRAKIRTFDEHRGNLYKHLQGLDDLVIIADESHLYGSSAAAFSAALKELKPAATIGLTASATDDDDVIYRYPLYRAIADRYVKQPVLVYRRKGYDKSPAGEERQLRDGLAVLRQKAAAYRTFIEDNPGTAPVNPVAFITCADIEHASAVAALLRGPGYLDSHDAVLQVDSKHDDENTRRALDTLDAPDSPVRAVVAVSKLREGWDVRNVAVIITLRASGSEVLTQQTMGRGLRLPFGAYTGHPIIDQLDIIAHDSYRKYLSDEDVLKDFGLDDALAPGDELIDPDRDGDGGNDGSGIRTVSNDTAGDAATDNGDDNAADHDPGAEDGAAGTDVDADRTRDTTIDDGDNNNDNAAARAKERQRDPAPKVRLRELGDEEHIADPDSTTQPERVTVRINEDFADEIFVFPSSHMATHTPNFDLATIGEDQARAAGAKVVAAVVQLERKEIIATDGALDTHRLDRIDGGTVPIDDEAAHKELMRAIRGTHRFQVTSRALAVADRHILQPFIETARPAHGWTEKTLTDAHDHMRGLIIAAADEHRAHHTTEKITITPVTLPIESEFTLPSTAQIANLLDDQATSADFRRHAYYGSWTRGLFDRASFDSFSGEYRIAALIDADRDVTWWKRLYGRDGATFAWGPGKTYVPDFVVCDARGDMWIVEGKADGRADDPEVLQKKAAAERVMRTLTADERFGDVRWGYLLATESEIAASDGWEELKHRAGFTQS